MRRTSELREPPDRGDEHGAEQAAGDDEGDGGTFGQPEGGRSAGGGAHDCGAGLATATPPSAAAAMVIVQESAAMRTGRHTRTLC